MRLALVGHPGGGAAHHPPQEADGQHTQDDRGDHRVDVQHPEIALTEGLLQEAQVVLDVGSRSQRGFGGGHFKP